MIYRRFLRGKESEQRRTNHLSFAMVGHPLLRFVGPFLPHAENLEIRFRRLEKPSCAKGLHSIAVLEDSFLLKAQGELPFPICWFLDCLKSISRVMAIRIFLDLGSLDRLIFPGVFVLESHRVRHDAEEVLGF